MSSHQQDLPDTTHLRGGLRFGRLAEWHLAADWDHQFAISDGLGHELKSFRISCRVHRYHFYSWVFLGIPWRPVNRCKHSSGLDLGGQFFSSLAVYRISYDIQHGKICDRIVVIGREQLICADGLRIIDLALQHSCNYDRSPLLRSEYRRTPDISSSTYDENRLARFDPGSGNELVASRRHQRQRRRLDQIESFGNFRQNRGFYHAKFGVGVRRHCKHLVASRKAFHSGSNRDDSPRNVHSHQPRKLDGVKVFRQPGASFVIDWIHTRGSDPHQYFTGTRHWVRVFLELEYFRTAILVDHNCFHISPPYGPCSVIKTI